MSSRKTFKFRLYPTPKQEQTLLFYLRRCRELYNAGLEERRAYYQMRRASLTCYTQINELPDLKQAFPAYQDVPSHVLQDVLRRLDKAFAAFFRRVRNGESPGYPRFKSTSRYHSFTYPDEAGWKLGEKHLTLSGVGDVKIRLHRPIQGKIKTVTIRRDVDQWYATFSCEVPEAAPLPPSDAAVGLDLGVLYFATLSTGEHIENPRHYRKGLEAHQAALPGEGPPHEGVSSPETGGHCPGACPSQGPQPTDELPSSTLPPPGQRVRPGGDGGPGDPEPDGHAGTEAGPGPRGAVSAQWRGGQGGLEPSDPRCWLGPVPILLHRQGCKCRTARGIG